MSLGRFLGTMSMTLNKEIGMWMNYSGNYIFPINRSHSFSVPWKNLTVTGIDFGTSVPYQLPKKWVFLQYSYFYCDKLFSDMLELIVKNGSNCNIITNWIAKRSK